MRCTVLIVAAIGCAPTRSNTAAPGLPALRAGAALPAPSAPAAQPPASGPALRPIRVDLPLHVVDVGLRGHWFDAPVFRALATEWPWLTEGDARWGASG